MVLHDICRIIHILQNRTIFPLRAVTAAATSVPLPGNLNLPVVSVSSEYRRLVPAPAWPPRWWGGVNVLRPCSHADRQSRNWGAGGFIGLAIAGVQTRVQFSSGEDVPTPFTCPVSAPARWRILQGRGTEVPRRPVCTEYRGEPRLISSPLIRIQGDSVGPAGSAPRLPFSSNDSSEVARAGNQFGVRALGRVPLTSGGIRGIQR